MSGHQVQPHDADIDMGKLFSAIWRDKFKILFGSLVITAIVFALLSLITPKYKADTRVLIDANESVYTRPTTENQPADQPIIDQESVASQVEIIRSSDLLLQVAEELDLASRAEFDGTKNMSSLTMGLITFGLVADPAAQPVDQRILEAMRDRLNIYPADPARVVVIEFESEDPELAAAVPNALARAYVSLESRAQLDSTGQAAAYLSKEIAQLQTELRDAEDRVADFRATTGLFESDNNETLATQQLAQLSTELSRVRTERSSVEARVQSVETALQSGAALDTLPDVIASPLIERLSEQQVGLQAQVADLSTTLLPNHPRIKALRSQLDDLSARIRSQAQKVLQGLRNEADINRDREQDLTLELNQLKAASSQAGSEEVELRALERDATSKRALLESYLIRFREAQSRDESQYAPAKARVIASALMPIEVTFPKLVPLLSAAFFGSLILMILATLMRELLSGRAMVPTSAYVPTHTSQEQPDTASTVVELPIAPKPAVVKTVETVETVEIAQAIEENASAANDNFSIAALTKQLIAKGAGRAIVVSPEGDLGSMCSVGIARALADEGLRSVLVDLTGTGASSQHMMDNFSAPGITELLASEASYSEVIHSDLATNAHIIPTGNADSELAMRGIDRLPIIINALASAYDVVVIDCGPTDAAGLKRLTTDESELILAMVEPDSQVIVDAAEDLLAGGYQDILIVTADQVSAPLPPSSNRRRATM